MRRTLVLILPALAILTTGGLHLSRNALKSGDPGSPASLPLASKSGTRPTEDSFAAELRRSEETSSFSHKRIEAYLRDHGRSAANLFAASKLSVDQAYLEEAQSMENDPRAQAWAGLTDATCAQRLRKLEPDNSYADLLALKHLSVLTDGKETMQIIDTATGKSRHESYLRERQHALFEMHYALSGDAQSALLSCEFFGRCDNPLNGESHITTAFTLKIFLENAEAPLKEQSARSILAFSRNCMNESPDLPLSSLSMQLHLLALENLTPDEAQREIGMPLHEYKAQLDKSEQLRAERIERFHNALNEASPESLEATVRTFRTKGMTAAQ